MNQIFFGRELTILPPTALLTDRNQHCAILHHQEMHQHYQMEPLHQTER